MRSERDGRVAVRKNSITRRGARKTLADGSSARVQDDGKCVHDVLLLPPRKQEWMASP